MGIKKKDNVSKGRNKDTHTHTHTHIEKKNSQNAMLQVMRWIGLARYKYNR